MIIEALIVGAAIYLVSRRQSWTYQVPPGVHPTMYRGHTLYVWPATDAGRFEYVTRHAQHGESRGTVGPHANLADAIAELVADIDAEGNR